MLKMLPTQPKLKMLSRLLALARPARLPITAPDGVRPLERMVLCRAVSSVLARVSLILLNMGSLAASSTGVDPDRGGRDNGSAGVSHAQLRVSEVRIT
jgi:hypothetical protein